MGIKSKFRSDVKVRDEGVWVLLPGADDGSKICVRSEDYEPYRKAIGDYFQRQGNQGPYSRRHQQDLVINTVEFDKVRARLYAEHIIVGWDIKTTTMRDEDSDAQVEFSIDTAKRLMTDPELYDFFLAVVEAVTNVTRAKSEYEDDRKKSSATDSSPT